MDRQEASVALFAVHEERMLAMGRRRLPVPVLLVSGNLGSGKTTFLNHILHNKLNLRITCLVNDLASLNIDAEVLVKRDAARRTLYLSNGCACHTLSKEFEGEMWRVLQETEGTERTDYVVIETSGVADPTSLVESLERRYGQMTRARLDGVVVMVDSDVLSHQLTALEGKPRRTLDLEQSESIGGGATSPRRTASQRMLDAAGPAVWRQLLCADIIILNKVDLLDAAAVESLQQAMQAAVPAATVITATHGKVPLHRILHVEHSQGGAGAGVAGHEARLIVQEGRYLTAEEARPSSRTPQGAWDAAANQAGAAAHGYHALEYTSDHPFRLKDFQDLVAAAGHSASGSIGGDACLHEGLREEWVGLWRRVERIKGVVWFAECREDRWVFQVSGRQRVHLHHDGKWTARPAVQLVAIGSAWDQQAARLLDAFHSLTASPAALVCGPCDAPPGSVEAQLAAARELVRSDRRFELLEDGDEEALHVGPVVHFQLVGAALYGISRAELESFHRVDVSDLNRHFVQRLNASISSLEHQPKPFMLGAPLLKPVAASSHLDDGKRSISLSSPQYTVRFAVGGICRLDHVWPAVSQIADDLLAHSFARLKLCKCDL
ncbi:hypothetical protein AB1Y20_017365 [Prymnesium parvum]|uniref:CobW C-terminal domain-containing protein n=1 Tax=Prymnesium parvum TaxID=97485 RepID=A0AB34JKB2_PRYPA